MRTLPQDPPPLAPGPPLASLTAPSLSLQFCAELNQPVLPNIRRWRGPRGCWKAVVADTPSTQLQKVRFSPKRAFSSHFTGTSFSLIAGI